MAGTDLRAVIRRLGGAAASGRAGGLADAELLRRFLAHRDGAAFEALVWRHAALVFGVCRRVLRDHQDAEDAFQATFLILAHKGPSIGKGDSVGSWLYRVAYRTALRAKAAAAGRTRYEMLCAEPAAPPGRTADWCDLGPVLDAEIDRLPEKYRRPFVLRYVHGLTCEEAARELGCPAGTVVTWLARARARLRAALTRRGVALPAGVSAVGILQNASALPVPEPLVRSAVEAGLMLLDGQALGRVVGPAAALCDRVTRSMVVTKLQSAVLTAVAAALAFGVGVFAYSTRPASAGAEGPYPDRPKAAAAEADGRRQARHTATALPPGAVARLGSTRFRSGGGVGTVAFAPDGKTLAYGGALWEAASGTRVAEYRVRPGDAVLGPTFSPDGTLAAAPGWRLGSSGGVAYVWDAATGRERHRLEPPPTPPRGGWVLNVAFSADSKSLIALAGAYVNFKRLPDNTPVWEADQGLVLIVWEVASGAVRRASRILTNNPADPSGPPPATCLSPGGKYAGAWVGPTLRVWDVDAGRELSEIRAGPAAVTFSPDGKLVYTAGARLACRETVSGTLRFDHPLSEGWSGTVSVSPDGRLLMVQGRDRSVSFRDAATGKELRLLPAGNQGGLYAAPAVLSPDGATLATESLGALCLWDVATGKELFPSDGHYGPVTAAAFSPDGRRVASAGQDGTICLWDRVGGVPPVRRARLPSGALALAYSPEGTAIRVCVHNLDRPGTSVRVIDATTGRELRKLPLEAGFDTSPGTPAAFSPDGKLLAGRGQLTPAQQGVILWSMETGKRVAGWNPAPPGSGWATGFVLAVAFAPDGTLASATPDTIQVRDVATGRVLRTILLQKDQARDAIAFSPAGLAFSADGRFLIATDRYGLRDALRLWEVESGREVVGVAGAFPAGAPSVAAAPDGVSFATGHADTTMLLWDIPALLRGAGEATTPGPLTAERARALWDDLGKAEDATRALRAVCDLAAAPARAVPLVHGELEQATPRPEQLQRLIGDLDAGQFAAREKATRELAEIGGPAEPRLRDALKTTASAEARQRIEKLLAQVRSESSPAARRWSRAVQALEYAGTPEAREVLERIGQGPLGTRRAEQARGAVDRLTLRAAAAAIDRKAR